jgi:hypothetical protein
MIDDTRFEDRLAQALRDHADRAVMPFDAAVIADRAIDTRRATPAWMRLALVATLGVAAVVFGVVVATQVFEGSVGIGGDSQLIGADELPGIVANASNTPGTWNQTLDEGGAAALNTPMRSGTAVELDGFVDGRTTQMCGTNEAGESIGCILAWTSLFATAEEAEAAYDFYVAEFEAPNGWNVPHAARSVPTGLGDEAALYTNVVDPDTGFTMSGVYLWREENLLLGAVGVADLDVAAIRIIADAMQARAD